MIANIVDKRRRRHRWKNVHVILEAIWQDNSVADSDQAEPTEPVVDYIEFDDMPLAEAISLAHAEQGIVTMFIYDAAEIKVPISVEVGP